MKAGQSKFCRVGQQAEDPEERANVAMQVERLPAGKFLPVEVNIVFYPGLQLIG